MMKFYNREQELDEIRHFSRKRPSMLVITGRRRVGKTELIKKTGDHVYLYVDDKKSNTLLIEEFTHELRQHFDIDPLIKVETWEEFVRLLFKIGGERECTFAFDEFQKFHKINPSIINQFQKHWDIYHDKTKIFLIFSGSSIGMMKKIFIEDKAPLFKRAQNILTLKPFDFQQISEILDDFKVKSFDEKIRIYSLFGGVINYYSLMDFFDAKNIKDILDRLLLRKFAPLKNEIKDIFVEEFGRQHSTYYSILTALANGKTTKKEITDVVDIKTDSLSPYLYDLIDLLDVVKYELPVTKDKKSKKGRYILKDNFFRFWFRFIHTNASHYEAGDYPGLKKTISSDINSFIGFGFEDLCRQTLEKKLLEIPIEYEKVGRWWSRRGDEIDIVALNPKEKKIMFGECKWKEKQNPQILLKKLKEKARLVSWHNRDRKEYYVLFAKSFTSKSKSKDTTLIDLQDLERIYENS